ncbi:MAG: LPS assembly lipoprotein LptE [Kiritimatiellae bacterium]|nr:LPS assembly lipoprotein LptE [Kiritimatiellia bacterium]
MRNQLYHIFLTLSALLMLAGCASYRFTSKVPAELRTIAVPVFENESDFPELDAIVTQYTLREFQREGTFKIKNTEDAAYKLIGCVTRITPRALSYNRNYNSRTSEYQHSVVVKISLIERSSGKILIDDMPVRARTSFLTQGDMLTGMQNASPRVARELAQSIVDTVLAQW